MASVEAVEKILKYSFENKSLLEEALRVTPKSSMKKSPLFQRLEFLGDSVLGLGYTNYAHLEYPNLNVNKLRQLRVVNVCNEKFARVAVKHGLSQFLVHNTDPSSALAERVRMFSEAVGKEDVPVAFDGCYGGSVKAPKILADLVESIAGAVYVDVNFDIQRLWEIFRGLLEPIYSLDDFRQQKQPIIMLSRLGDELGKRIDIRCCNGPRAGSTTAQVFLDDTCIASGHSKHTYVAKLLAAKEALQKLSECKPTEKVIIIEDSVDAEVEDAKGKLSEICSTEKLLIQSSSLPTTSENPLPYEMTPNQTVTDEDSLQVEPEDVKEKLSEICSTKKLQMQTGSSSLPTVSENPLTSETTPTKMVIDGDSLHVEPEEARENLVEIRSSEMLQMQTRSSSLPTASENPLIYEMTPKQIAIDEDSLEVEPEDAKGKLYHICIKKKWPKPIFSFEERGGTHEKRFVCSVKIEIPTIEGTFHMKGDEKPRKKEAENSSAYHMIRALRSSLMSLVIKNLEMQESLEDKKRKRKRRKMI